MKSVWFKGYFVIARKIWLQVSGQLDEIQQKLDEQSRNTIQILEIVAGTRYLDGVEQIEAFFTAFMNGEPTPLT
jgi:hypothetical protein